jgi:hypothetical protein
MATLLLGMLRARTHGLAELPEASRPFEQVVDLFVHGASGNGITAAQGSENEKTTY